MRQPTFHTLQNHLRGSCFRTYSYIPLWIAYILILQRNSTISLHQNSYSILLLDEICGKKVGLQRNQLDLESCLYHSKSKLVFLLRLPHILFGSNNSLTSVVVSRILWSLLGVFSIEISSNDKSLSGQEVNALTFLEGMSWEAIDHYDDYVISLSFNIYWDCLFFLV